MTSRTHMMLAAFGRILRLSALALLPALAAHGGPEVLAKHTARYGPTPQPREPYSAPYLVAIGPAPLRFREPPAPPSYEIEPVATGPAHLDEGGYPTNPLPARERLEPTVNLAPPPKTNPIFPDAKQPTPDSDAPPLLPDDTRRDVRPEDLLPYFQFPKAGTSGVGIGIPAPAQPPVPTQIPSSATYRQL